MKILWYCTFHSNTGLYTTFIFQKPDPEIAPPIPTPLLPDVSYNLDEVINIYYRLFYLDLPFYYDQFWFYFLECVMCLCFFLILSSLTSPITCWYNILLEDSVVHHADHRKILFRKFNFRKLAMSGNQIKLRLHYTGQKKNSCSRVILLSTDR